MYLAIFIAANHRLPLSPKEQSGRVMHVAELLSSDEVVRKQFSNPYIYGMIGNDGCACDFHYDPRERASYFLKKADKRKPISYSWPLT